jgi:hypothetical protein
MQYLEAIGRLLSQVKEGKLARPLRTIHLSYLPDEEIGPSFLHSFAPFVSPLGGADGAAKFRESELFAKLNIGIIPGVISLSCR